MNAVSPNPLPIVVAIVVAVIVIAGVIVWYRRRR